MSTFIENLKVCLHWDDGLQSAICETLTWRFRQTLVHPGLIRSNLSILRASVSIFQDQYDHFSPQPVFTYIIYFLALLPGIELHKTMHYLRPPKAHWAWRFHLFVLLHISHYTQHTQITFLLNNYFLFQNLAYPIHALTLFQHKVHQSGEGGLSLEVSICPASPVCLVADALAFVWISALDVPLSLKCLQRKRLHHLF